ncbi:MAG: phosphoglycerate dehydrogenase [Chloroflexi bacterium]|nr:phosphoglycerate dehydrogenase [Chloroflexota bacterium]MCI0575538.1 phosphoglycerate dehydrogenase [Chloroflexota bacterium]MCI0644315.1 phosphoglycerate dehydrogenase [Chloroflexota bacterium]MCI0726298.1 phosphoglycerate dehydrogenase [Chloroflexota bacterium]
MHVFISTSSFGNMDRQPLAMLEAAGIVYRLNPYGRKLKPEESVQLLVGVDGLIAGTELLDRGVLAQAPRLRIVSRCGTGLDSVDLAAAAELGIRVTNTPDAHVDAVAELTLAGILDLLRRVSCADHLVRQGQWVKPMGRLLRGKTVGIVGLGRVGKALVQLLQPFAVTVLAYDPYQDPVFAGQYGVRYIPLEELLGAADVVSLHLSYSRELRHFVDGTRLALMKPEAILVNVARGGLVDEAALAACLQSGRLAGAYLDTFEQEPYQGPLAGLENVVLTPHIGSYAAEARLRMEMEAVENLLRFFQENGRLPAGVRER